MFTSSGMYICVLPQVSIYVYFIRLVTMCILAVLYLHVGVLRHISKFVCMYFLRVVCVLVLP